MSNQETLVREAIELLHVVREKVHNDGENCVVQQIDEAILKLQESCQEQQYDEAKQDALKALGEAIKWIPAIAKLIEVLLQ